MKTTRICGHFQNKPYKTTSMFLPNLTIPGEHHTERKQNQNRNRIGHFFLLSIHHLSPCHVLILISLLLLFPVLFVYLVLLICSLFIFRTPSFIHSFIIVTFLSILLHFLHSLIYPIIIIYLFLVFGVLQFSCSKHKFVLVSAFGYEL